jgi:predicted phage terminase large subunit-like protein
MSLDPAVTDKKKSDFSAFVINMTDVQNRWHIYEADAFKGKPSEVVDRFVQYALRYRPSAISIESVAAQILYKELITPALREAKINTVITDYNPSNQISKQAKILKLQPRFKKGLVVIRHGLKELVRQLDEFPENDHDDLLDALCQQDAISRPPTMYEMANYLDEEDNFDLESSELGELKPGYANVGYGTPRR